MSKYFAKLSTAITIPFGPVLDSVGAEYTSAVVGDVKICKNNGSPAALNASATLTHKEVGIYELVLTTSDISAVGQATIVLSKTTYVAPPIAIAVLPAMIYDSLIAGTDRLDTNITHVADTSQTAGDIVALVNTVDDFLDTEVAAILADTNELQTDWADGGRLDLILDARASQTSLDTLDDYVDTEVAAIKTKTDQLTFTVANQVDANALTGGGSADRLLLVDTTIDTLASQTSFTLVAGSADDNAYNNMTIVIEDSATSTQKAIGIVSDYVGSTKTITLYSDPAIFTMAVGDKVYILAVKSVESILSTIIGYIDTEIAAIKAKTDNLPASPASTADTLAALTTAQTESYAADNGNATVVQLLYEIRQNLTDFSITGTTKTVYKKDGSTTAATYTLDSSTVPTAITRTT